jgi:prepilin-type N-terminal cleavage/methylation domain-containing protein
MKRSYGFTLLELLVVMMIMGTFFGFSFAEFRGFQRRQRIDSVVRTLLSDLQQAKTDAFVGRKPTNIEGCTENFLGYRFDLGPAGGGNQEYEIIALCGVDFDDPNPEQIVTKTVLLPQGIRVTAPGSPNADVDFWALGRGASWQGGNTPKRGYVVSDTAATDFELYIYITKSGVVYMSDVEE